MAADSESLGDDFLELRFDPKYKQIFEEQFVESDTDIIQRDYSIPLEFKGKIDDKTKSILSNLVGRVFSNAESQQLYLQNTNPQVIFFSKQAWAKTNDDQNELNLPASMISWQAGYPVIQVIIPNKIESYETVIKTVRLVFSKLFGTLYFNENILKRKPFKELSVKKASFGFDTLEKMYFCRQLDLFPQSALAAFKHFSSGFKLKKNKAVEFGKNEFFKSIEDECKTSEASTNNLLDECFDFHMDRANENRDQFLKECLDNIFQTTPKIGVILPHEDKTYRLLHEKNQWSAFDGIAEKLQYVTTCIQDLKDCQQYFAINQSLRISDFSESDYWLGILNGRINYLKRKRLVKLFLIENSILTPEQKREQLEFPLWIWRQKLFENYPGKYKSEKIIQLISNQYKNSIYQKLFEAAFRAVNCFQAYHKRTDSKLDEIPDFKRFQELINGIEIRVPIIKDLLHTCRICSHLSLEKEVESADKEKTMSEYEQGWSYFISFALIHQFYLLHTGKQREKADKFLEIIKVYIEKRIENQIRFQIAFLFLQIYLEEKCALKLPLKIIREGSETLDFYVLNHQKITRQNADLKEILTSYASSIIKSGY